MSTKKLAELAEFVNGLLEGDPGTLIDGVNNLEQASGTEISFLTDPKKVALLATTKAAAVVVAISVEDAPLPVIKVANAALAFAMIHGLFLEEEFIASGISPQAHVGAKCSIPEQVSVGPMVVLGDRVSLGKQVTIHSGCVIGDDVEIGDQTVLHGNVTLYAGTRIGCRVIVHSGTVIGADGFGYATDQYGAHLKRPHVGRVVIEDDVELGANVCVDRATFGETRICSGTKIDNLVQVAHNVDIGANTLMVAQSGVAGSSSLGRNVVVGGQVAITGHVKLGDQVMVGGQSGVHNSQKAGSVVTGTPAIPHKIWLKASIAFQKLPELIKDVRRLKKQVSELLKTT